MTEQPLILTLREFLSSPQRCLADAAVEGRSIVLTGDDGSMQYHLQRVTDQSVIEG